MLTRAPISINNPSSGTPPTYRQHARWRLIVAQILTDGVKAHHLGVGAYDEENPGHHRTLNHNGL